MGCGISRTSVKRFGQVAVDARRGTIKSASEVSRLFESWDAVQAMRVHNGRFGTVFSIYLASTPAKIPSSGVKQRRPICRCQFFAWPTSKTRWLFKGGIGNGLGCASPPNADRPATTFLRDSRISHFTRFNQSLDGRKRCSCCDPFASGACSRMRRSYGKSCDLGLLGKR